jgi:hypothetical protein
MSEMTALVALGVDRMFTNFLDRLNGVRGSAQSLGKQGPRDAARRSCWRIESAATGRNANRLDGH